MTKTKLSLERLALHSMFLAAAIPLAGCPMLAPPAITCASVAAMPAAPLPSGSPDTGGPCYCIRPTHLPGHPILTPSPSSAGDGLSLADAYHDAIRYLADQSADSPAEARLVSAQAIEVGADGRSGSGGWTFVFSRVSPYPTPSPSLAPDPSPSEAPAPTASSILGDGNQEISVQVDGQGDVMAPVDLPRSGDAALDFRKVASVSSILATVADLGSPAGPYGYSVVLRTDAQNGPVFAVDAGVIYRDVPAGPVYQATDPQPQVLPGTYTGSVAGTACGGTAPGQAGTSMAAASAPVPKGRPAVQTFDSVAMVPYPNATAAYRGTYLLDAYSGNLLSLPSQLQ